MAYLDPHTFHLPQRTIKVSIEFYDATEKAKLLKYPTASVMLEIVRDSIEIPTEEFLTYYLFHKKRPGKVGWRDYREVGRHIDKALSELTDWIDFNGESISTPGDVESQERYITEHIGESIGMSVVNRIHGLTAADWDRIPEGTASTFDYKIASDGNHVVQMEAKGTSTSDNSLKTSSVSAHKANIATKKERIDKLEAKAVYPHTADLRYGVITIVGENRDTPVRSLLVDPPSIGDGSTAKRLRLLHRMRFLTDWISFISPRSQFASALQTRLGALEQLEDPFSLSGVPLKRGNGEPFETFRQSFWGAQSSFFASKAKIQNGPAGGVTVPLASGDLFFLGIREVLLDLAATQNFPEIENYKAEQTSIEKIVECNFSERTFRRLRLPPETRQRSKSYGGYHYLQVPAEIHYSDSGILFGVLPIADAKAYTTTL